MDANRVKSNIINQEDDANEIKFRGNLPAFRGIASVIKKKVKKVKIKKDINNINKIYEADAKRQNALAEKWNTLQNQKYTIANALKGESSNKKIIFNEDGDQQECKANKTNLTKKKISLFDDDDANESENQELVSDFKLKLKFEGEKGKKLFHMQTSKATGDDRFVMDKRFFNDQEITEKINDDEIEKQMNILEDVVGRSITKSKKDIEDQIFNMVRYDPTQEEHKKYEQDKQELPKQKKVPKKQKQNVEQAKKPIVDTVKYYKIGDKLKDVFSTQSKFSLTDLFHTSDKSGNKLENYNYNVEKITKPLKKFGQNPFIDDSSDSDDEKNNFEENVDNFNNKIEEVSSGKMLGSRGVWREVFFFKIDDSRFKDAEEFCNPRYNTINYTGSQDPKFIKNRDILRDFLKNKDKRHKRDVGKKRFSRKLGGTHCNQKHHNVHHSKSKKIKNKIERKKILKSNKINNF